MQLPSLNFTKPAPAAQPQARPTQTAAPLQAYAPLFTAGGIALPTIFSAAPRSSSVQTPSLPKSIETSFFAQAKVQLQSPLRKVGVKRDKKGAITILPNPSVIKFTVDKYQTKFLVSDKKLELKKGKGANVVSLRDSSRTVVTIQFRSRTAMLSFLTTIYLHRKQEGDKFCDVFVGEGHQVNNRDDYDVSVTSWLYKTQTQLGDLVFDKEEFDCENTPPSIKPFVEGLAMGGLRIIWKKKKAVAIQLKELREFRPRVRIPVVYDQLVELEKLCYRLSDAADTMMKRQRVQKTVEEMKHRCDELNAAVDMNTLMIEQMHEEKEQFLKKMSETERAKQRIDVDESEKEMHSLKEQRNLRAVLNETVEKSDEFELQLMKYSGESELLAKCISDAFVAVCIGLTESEDLSIEERLENTQREIAESVFL